MVKRTFIVHYEQWLEQDADALGWSEHKEITVRLTSDALTSGWLLQFSNTPLDYLVLTVISLHARLMNAKDLEWLSKFGLATDADLGRMFSYATDMTIAAELGIHRTTVAACAERLAENNNLVIRSMDGEQHNQLRQSGNFKGRKIYIIAGGVALKKSVTDLESRRVGSTDTVESYRVSPTDTVTPQDQPTVSVQPTHRVSPTDTNINTLVVDVDQSEHIFDFRDDIPYILNIMDIFVLPSLEETYSMATVEAMLSAKPVVATQCGGPEELIIDNDNGLLVKPGEQQELAQKIIYLIKNNEIARKMGSSSLGIPFNPADAE